MVDIDAVDVQGMTALALAATEGRHRAVEMLLKRGTAEVAAVAASAPSGDEPRALSLDIPNFEAKSPLHMSFRALETVKRLVRAGARVDLPSALTNGAGADTRHCYWHPIRAVTKS